MFISLPVSLNVSKLATLEQTSKPVKGEEAFSLGLVDAIIPPEELISAARKWALDISERRKPWIISLHKTDKLESLADAREIFKFARAQVRKQAPNLKHPLVCLDVVETGVVSGPRAGLRKVVFLRQLFFLKVKERSKYEITFLNFFFMLMAGD